MLLCPTSYFCKIQLWYTYALGLPLGLVYLLAWLGLLSSPFYRVSDATNSSVANGGRTKGLGCPYTSIAFSIHQFYICEWWVCGIYKVKENIDISFCHKENLSLACPNSKASLPDPSTSPLHYDPLDLCEHYKSYLYIFNTCVINISSITE